MRPRSTNSVLRHLRQVVLRHQPDGLTDAQLLEAFLTQHEEAAFAALVRRHGPMVFGVCRRILGDRHDAEDAFQATFLVLLRKASSIRPGQAVGPWLHGVAQRTARRAREALARRRAGQKRLWERGRRAANASYALEDWRPLLDEELSRLPEKYRVPIVLCDLQGRTHKEAARELGWPQGTLSGRLWRARALLARRLTRRGLTLSATVLTLAYAEDAAFANLATPLIQTTIKAARMVMEGGTAAAGGVSASVAALTQGVLKAMWMTKVRIAAAMLLTASLGTGVFLYAARTQAQPRAEERIFMPLADPAPAIAGKPPEKADDPVPRVEDLIRYLNNNARLVEGLRCSVNMDYRDGKRTIGLTGMLACQRPRHVQLQAKIIGQPAIVLGCNDEGYWCWLRAAEPPTLWRGRRDEERRSGPQHWPEPYRPEWLLDVLGIAEYDPKKPYSLRATKEHLELSETVHSPQGQPLRKVIVFHRLQQTEGSQIAAVLLKNADDKVLCRADIKRVYTDKETGARLTQTVVISWPDDRLKVHLHFCDFKLEAFSSEQAAKLFASPWSKGRSTSGEQTQTPSAPIIQIDLTKEHMQAHYREDVLKLSGQPNDPLALRVLQELLRRWASQEKQAALCITCSADAKYVAVKAVLDACRDAGIRKIELRTPRRD
jgi:RNA polymerase sigma factor (sigma-70 family)